MTDTLYQEHVPSPEIDPVQFAFQLCRQFKPEFQDGTYDHTQGSNMSHKGKDL
jgi:hypothetical protein